MRRILLLTLVVIGAMASSVLATVPHLINFQGFLRETVPPKNPANGTFDITFTIYDNLTGGSIIWAETQVGVVVDVGNFSVLLGSVTTLVDTVFNDTTRFLGIKVEADPEVAPRSRLVTMPYAFRSFLSETAVHADSATVSATAAFADSTDAITDGAVDMADIGQAGATSGQVLKWNGSAWGPATDDAGGASGWVDEGTVVRLETASDSVGIGTSSPAEKLDVVGNLVVSGKATIGSGHTNTGTSAFVAGENNVARGIYSVVAGGGGGTQADSNSASGAYSAIGGGRRNIADSSYATVGGGFLNTASGISATVSGGFSNITSGTVATVGGGNDNAASGDYATVGGGANNSASGDYSSIGGGRYDTASGSGSSVAGGILNVASGLRSTIGGGLSNTVDGIVS
ncbi:MAG: hypothetical protein IIB00_09000, partial [candidate division Zixibacteria bacterium]|nr:hypothetical protein [candidate division Zixibacteria bacterium]